MDLGVGMNITDVGIGKLKTKAWKVSPTQVKKVGECFRSWGFVYIEDMKSEAGAGAILGSDTHTEYELHFKGERAIDTSTRAGRIAKSGLHLLPEVGDHGLVEPPIYFTFDGVIYRGFVDLTWTESDGLGFMVKVVSDHKTSKNPKKYGLTSEQLLTDPQALIYAVWALHYFNVDLVRLQWTYLPTEKGKPYAVRCDITREQALKNFMSIVHPVGLAIVDSIKTIDEAKDLPANPLSCGLYGGCPHAAYCPRSSKETLTAIFGGQNKDKHMGLKDLIKSKKKAPPRPEELANVVDIKGQRINSPEAPASPEIARTISQSGDGHPPKEADNIRKSAAAAAAGATTPEEAKQRIEDAEPEMGVGVPKDWDPSVTPSQDQVLAWVCSGTFIEFIPDRKKATTELPFAHGRSLGSMGRAGLIDHKRDGDVYKVKTTAKGVAKFKTIKDGDVWVSRVERPALPAAPKSEVKTYDPKDVTVSDLSVGKTYEGPAVHTPPQKQLVAIYRRIDGKIIIEIDPEGIAT